MAVTGGENALVYVGGVEMPQRNSWSLDISREYREARVFTSNPAAGSWTDQIPGYRSWSGSIDGYYDNADESPITAAFANTAAQIVLYEDRNNLNKYWYGNAFVDMSEQVPADDFVTLSLSFTGTGQLTRISM